MISSKDISFFEMGLELLSNHLSETNAIIESTSIDNELQSIFHNTPSIDEIVKKILNDFVFDLKSLNESFEKFINNSSDELINQNRYKLENNYKPIKLSGEYYDIKNIINSESLISCPTVIQKYIINLYKLSMLKDLMSSSDVISSIKMFDSPENNINFNELRGALLGKIEGIKEIDYKKELTKYFYQSGNKNITESRYREAFNEYFNPNICIAPVIRDVDIIEKKVYDLDDSIIGIKSFVNMCPEVSSKDIYKQFDILLKHKMQDLKEICKMFTIYHAERLDALKKYHLYNIKILKLELKEISKEV